MNKKIKTCEHCGAKMVEYPHIFNRGLAKGLIMLDRCGGISKLDDIPQLTYNQRNNFQKIQYWGLIQRAGRTCQWMITDRGIDFLTGKITIPKKVYTYRNEVVRYEDQQITMEDAMGEYAYWYREQYIEGSRNRPIF